MKACVDVQYGEREARAACVLFTEWTDATPARELVTVVRDPAPYEPGALYKRELPCLLAVLAPVRASLEVVLVDGYVWLDAAGRKGLGAHLHEALDGRVPVIGVAKTAFKGSDFAVAVTRGASAKPLYVTAAGLDARVAAEKVRALHGSFRLPTLLQRVDRLARGG